MSSLNTETITQYFDKLKKTIARIFPKFIGDVQPRSSWAEPLRSIEDVPEAFRPFFASLPGIKKEFPYCVLTPNYKGYIKEIAEKVVCSIGQEMYVLEKQGDGYAVQRFPIADVSFIEFQRILLDSHITITGRTNEGIPASCDFKFNTVTEVLFDPIINKIRLAGIKSIPPVLDEELEKFDDWYNRNYKFMNYGKRSLVGGERVLYYLLQPEMRTKLFSLFGMTFSRWIAPTLAAILTERELIVIREEYHKLSDNRYGGIWNYIQLNKIKELSVRSSNNGLLTLNIQLPDENQLSYQFDPAAHKELDQLISLYKKIPRHKKK